MSDNNSNAIILLTPEIAIQRAKDTYQIVKELREKLLTKDVDFGVIPGTDKPTLLKPGAEKLARAFGYCPVFETVSKVERWEDDSPLFHYEIRCRLIRIEDGKEIATGLGSCNSKENRYRWRWVEETEVPAYLDKSRLKTRSSARSEFAFAIEKAETGGQYGKPVEYWNEWKTAIASGAARAIKRKTSKGKEMDAWEMGSNLYRIPNDEIFSLVNTIEKMATKRALIAAVLIGVGASEFFTQDIEDLRDFGADVVEGEFVEIPTTPPATQPEPEKLNSTANPPPSVENGGREADWTAFWKEYNKAGLLKDMFKAVTGVNKPEDTTPAEATRKMRAFLLSRGKPTYGQSSAPQPAQS